MSVVEVGLRVVRGPDWNWGAQDGGLGHTGTVVEVGGSNSVTTPDKTVVVIWDSGNKTNYRVGYQNAHDLCVFDSAAAGVHHPQTVCAGCKERNIRGMRWRCAVCPELDLCTPCYMQDRHDTSHPCVRFERSTLPGVEVPCRRDSTKHQLKGIFTNAKVVRGVDWEWGDQDGNKVGRVTDIHGWDNESGRSVANVSWVTGVPNVYRLGHQGKVDLMHVTNGEAGGGPCYLDHLPAPTPAPPTRPARVFSMGDRVQVAGDAAALQAAQEGHGGWNPRMMDFIGQAGVVHRITDRGDIRVQYSNGTRWTINPAALVRVSPLAVGDTVRVLEDAARVRLLQKGHGEWSDMMKACLGKTGQITKIYADGDLRVSVDGQTWTINPMCVSPLCPGPPTADPNSMRSRDRDDQPGALVSFISSFLEQHKETSLADRLVRDAAQGRTEAVRQWLEKQRDKVDCKSSGRTALQLACHQGHMETVRLLLHRQASVAATDDDGDTPLHYSAFGYWPEPAEIMELLIRKSCDVNATNRGQCSALHVSVNKQHVGCVRVLVKAGCDPNLQDMYGDTALHDAIGKDNLEIIELLGNVPALDFKIKNKRGFNVLHHDPALKAITSATRPLVETLVTQSGCCLDAVNNRRQTPLLLAVSQLHLGIVEYLISRGASVLLADEDGDTPLHLAGLKLAAAVEVRPGEAPLIHGIKAHLATQGSEVSLVQAMACYLALEGAPLEVHQQEGGGQCAPVPAEVQHDPCHSMSLSLTVPTVVSLSMARAHSCEPQPGPCPQSTATATSPSQSPEEQSAAAVASLAEKTAKLKLDSDEVGPIVPAGLAFVDPAGDGEYRSCNSGVVAWVCCELPACVEFEPCGHRVTCNICCARMKKCVRCQTAITPPKRRRERAGIARFGRRAPNACVTWRRRSPKLRRSTAVRSAWRGRRNVVFLCGHGACAVCAHALQNCHMCRKAITQKINIY
ncbi:LOW QUALITY PROTEIN: E3 ubiquitin-protein ligase MIB2-like [Pollicipes pollicipes]|uniref:LOW QUALITY PROTEIN: E3 ubiquitin-protein ligase MIB2-like n=1 Tax=Pollicipes pollicipes TaxID=41117 RepID=UPI0018859021|nr:LOW QUALITY PROTEIN: E3 ubiquitin-protein ligase MIB2-like [Pollicipes pollicipes]